MIILFIAFIEGGLKSDKIYFMENSKDSYRRFNEQRLVDKAAPKVDMLKVMDTFKRGVDLYNSFGIKGQDKTGTCKKPLAEANNWSFIYLFITNSKRNNKYHFALYQVLWYCAVVPRVIWALLIVTFKPESSLGHS